jgi:hypothetical protein
MALRATIDGWVKLKMYGGSFSPAEQGVQAAQILKAIDVASVAANTTAEQTFSVPGLDTGDSISVSKPSLSAGLGVVNARVSAADTLAITFINATAAPIDPASETYKITVLRINLK